MDFQRFFEQKAWICSFSSQFFFILKLSGKDSTPLLQKYTCGVEYGTMFRKSCGQESPGKRKYSFAASTFLPF